MYSHPFNEGELWGLTIFQLYCRGSFNDFFFLNVFLFSDLLPNAYRRKNLSQVVLQCNTGSTEDVCTVLYVYI
jgi:hypothetical protein